MPDEDATVASTPSSKAASSSPADRPAPGTDGTRETQDLHTFAGAMRRVERRRVHALVPAQFVIAAIAGALLPFAGGGRDIKIAAYAAMAVSLVLAGYLRWLSADEHRYTETRVGAIFFFGAPCIFVAVLYWGVSSPAPMISALGLFFVAVGRSPRWAVALYLFLAALHAGFGVAIGLDLAVDPGLVRPASLASRDHLISQAMVQVMLLSTFVIARGLRQQLDRAVAEHDRAIREVAQRDAQLIEARQAIDEVVQVGRPGRFSRQRLGDYELGMIIGRGGMGEIYEGTQLATGLPVAVKVLSRASTADTQIRQRFTREALAVQSVASPHVVRLLEVGDKDGVPYLVMERLTGADLADVLRDRGRLDVVEAVVLARHAALGLDAARAAGIVHRDVKPQNIFRDESGPTTCWKLLDFGVSKLAQHGGTLTQGAIIGTPVYMAPEQARGGEVDHRADVYGLACVLYRALTGRMVFAGTDLPALLYQVAHVMPGRPSELCDLSPTVAVQLDRVLAIGLAKRPDDRFAKATELADAFASALAGTLDAAASQRGRQLEIRDAWGSRVD